VAFHVNRGRHLVRLFGADMLCEEIDLAALIAYSDKRLGEDAQPDRHTIRHEHSVLRHALRLAKDVGFYMGDPSKLKVEGFIEARGHRGYYQPGETWLEKVEWIEALVAHTSVDPDKHRVDRRDDILVYVNLGLRRRETLLLKPEHVDLTNATLTVRMPRKESARQPRRTGLKTDKSKRVLPLNKLMVELFRRRLREASAGQPLFSDWGSGNRDLRSNWQRARAWLLERAGQESGQRARADLEAVLPATLTFNDLRRTFCSLMKNAGVSLEDCAELLGHEDVTMVKLVYGHTAMETLHRAVAKLPEMSLPPQEPPRVKVPSRRERQLQRWRDARAAREARELREPAVVTESAGD